MYQFIDKAVQFPDVTMQTLEFFGKISSGNDNISIGRLSSKQGWSEPRQCPDFDEYTLVLAGALHVAAADGSVTVVRANQAIHTPRGESVQYSTPEAGGADYISVCVPAFTMERAHRDNR